MWVNRTLNCSYKLTFLLLSSSVLIATLLTLTVPGGHSYGALTVNIATQSVQGIRIELCNPCNAANVRNVYRALQPFQRCQCEECISNFATL